MSDFSKVAQQLYRVAPDGRMIFNDLVGKDVWFRAVVTDDDIRATLRINESLFGSSKKFTEDELVQSRRLCIDKNPDMYRLLQVDGSIIGFIATFPLPMTVINQLLASEIRVSDIQIDDIQIYTPGVTNNVFLQTLGLHKHIQNHQKRLAGIYLISGMWSLLNDLGRRGIEFERIYTRSDEPDGINLSHALGLDEIPAPPGVNKQIFVLDFAKQNQPFLQEYRLALKTYKTP